MSRTRTFIAVEIDAGIRHNAQMLQQKLEQVSSGIRWASAETLHVTLLFLGDVEDRHLSRLCREVETAVHTIPSFVVHIAGLGAFPDLRRPKVIWAGVRQGHQQLQTVHQAIATRLIPAGLYQAENRPYTPHLTLGRVPPHVPTPELSRELLKRAHWEGGSTLIHQVVVFASQLHRHGPVHTPLCRAPLATPQPTS